MDIERARVSRPPVPRGLTVPDALSRPRRSRARVGALASIGNAPGGVLRVPVGTKEKRFYADTLPAVVVDIFSGRIARAWKAHRDRAANGTQDSVDGALRSTHPDYVTREYQADNLERYPTRGKEMGRLFYCARKPGVPYLYYPHWTHTQHRKADEPPCVEKVATGISKRCTNYGGANVYVALEPLAERHAFTRGRLDLVRELFSDRSTLVFNTFINPGLMIARDAGIDLFEFMVAGGVLDLDALRDVVADVTALHAMPEGDGAFFRDLKPENICLRGTHASSSGTPSCRLSIVDFEDSLVFGMELAKLDPTQLKGTKDYLTCGLVLGLYGNPDTQRRFFAESADLYALLRTVIAVTAEPASWLRHEALGVDPRRLLPTRAADPTGILHAGNAVHFMPWIEKHVHAAHQRDAQLLLENPAQFARESPHPASLLQMLRFQTPALSRCRAGTVPSTKRPARVARTPLPHR